MGDILSKLQMVSEKIGVTETAHTIEEQVDLISESLDKIPHSTNIAEALDDLSEVAQNINNEEVYIDKTITENGTYLPASDEATAYSKVVVDVASENIIPPIVAIYPIPAWDMEKGGNNDPIPLVLIYNNGNNNIINANTIYDSNKYSVYGAAAWNSDGQAGHYSSAKLVITNPAKRINYIYDELIIFFTPSEDFEGVYKNETKITAGDTITPGDGYIYMVNANSITKFHRIIDGTYISE